MKKIFSKGYLLSFVLALWASALSAQSHRSFDYRQYQNDMTVYYDLQLNGSSVLAADRYELAAFVDGECRGIGSVETATGANGTTLTYGYLRIYSNVSDDETVTFKVYDRTADEELECTTAIAFEANAAAGLPSAMTAIAIKPKYIVGDANGDGVVSIADVTAIINKINDAVSGSFVDVAADVNSDGVISIADVTGVINIINQ